MSHHSSNAAACIPPWTCAGSSSAAFLLYHAAMLSQAKLKGKANVCPAIFPVGLHVTFDILSARERPRAKARRQMQRRMLKLTSQLMRNLQSQLMRSLRSLLERARAGLLRVRPPRLLLKMLQQMQHPPRSLQQRRPKAEAGERKLLQAS